jgi:hypothetical protein
VARRDFLGGIARDMKKGLSFPAAACAVVTLVSIVAVQPVYARAPKIAAPKAFKANFAVEVGESPQQQGIMYFSHGRIREEVTPAGGGPKTVSIIDQVTKTIYVLDSEKKTFKVLPWDARSALISEGLKRFEKHKLVDTKTIDGQECEDFEIHPKDPNIKPFYLFVNKTTRFPVQLTTVDPDPSKQIHIKWTNLTPGYQPAIMFAPPLGYQEIK